MWFLLLVILTVFVFEYINGFHDAANAIATVVSTRVLLPRAAVLLAAAFNLVGALSGEAVAKTVGAGLVDTAYVTSLTILAAMLAGIALGELDRASAHDLVKVDAVFRPDPSSRGVYDRLYDEFTKLYKSQKDMFHRLNRPPRRKRPG